jgi:tetratricopeptide (TPR) repeat protein
MSVLQNPKVNLFLALNQQVLAELVTFVDFAEGLTIGFVEINFAADGDALVEALRKNPACKGIRFEVLNLSRQPDLRFLRDELVQRLSKLEQVTDQKRVLIVRGLEAAIGTDGVGAYPPVLQDLNFVRDAYRTSVPYPILFMLPDYAITRIAKYAPDFWAWSSGVFIFKTPEQTCEALRIEVMDVPAPYIASVENQEQIEQLKQLLMEYHPSGKPITPENQAICADLYYKLGSAYITQQQATKAQDYLAEALKLAQQRENRTLQQSVYRQLGEAYLQSHEFDNAIAAYSTSKELAEAMGNQSQVATALYNLGTVALEQRQFQQAKRYYQQCLELEKAQNDRYSQASTYHNLGAISLLLQKFDEAQRYHQQALDIYIEYGDRYKQARTYHQMGIVAQKLREFDEARRCYQKALEIFTEYGDRYSQASSYQNLGIVAQEVGEFDEAQRNYQQALEIFTEYGDRYKQASAYHQLGIIAQKLGEFDEAQRDYQQALEIKIEYGDRYSQGSTYHQMGMIVQALGQFEEAQRNYQQALEIYIEYGDRYSQGSTYHQIGTVAHALGQFKEAQRNYRQALEIYIEYGDRYSQASTYFNLGSLAEAEENFSEASINLLKALEIFVEFQENHSVEIVLRNLAHLYQTIRKPELLSSISQVLGASVKHMQELFGQIQDLRKSAPPSPPNLSPESVIDCTYTNHSDDIQIVRISNIENWYFERVVFPAQMIMFTATPQGTLDIYTCDHAGALLDERIPCSRLAIADSIAMEVSRATAEQ